MPEADSLGDLGEIHDGLLQVFDLQILRGDGDPVGAPYHVGIAVSLSVECEEPRERRHLAGLLAQFGVLDIVDSRCEADHESVDRLAELENVFEIRTDGKLAIGHHEARIGLLSAKLER